MARPGWRDWDETTLGSGTGAIATRAAESGVLHKVTSVSGRTDADALIQIRDGDETGTILWEIEIEVAVNGKAFAINIPNGVQSPTPGNAITGYLTAGTSTNCRINLGGESIP